MTATSSLIDAILPEAQAGEWDEVCAKVLAHVSNTAEDAESLYLLALTAFAQNNLAKAAATAHRAVERKDAFAECADLVAISHGLTGDINTALYYAKLMLTLPSRPDLQALLPEDFPTFADVLKTAEQDRLITRARIALSQGQVDLAGNLLRQHLYFFPDDENAMLLTALCLSLVGDHMSAVEWLRGGVHRRPHSAKLLSALANELAQLGNFADAQAVHERAVALAPDDAIICARKVHDLTASPAIPAAEAHRLAQAWGERFATEGYDAYGSGEEDGPRSIGIILSDLPGTLAGSFLADILSRANPTEFRFVGYGCGVLTDIENQDFQRAFTQWYDITELDAETIGDMLRAESLDMVIDTAGFASPLSLAALGGRCAPHQVMWRNAPYGCGLAAIDAHFTDATLDAATGPRPEGRALSLALGTALAPLPADETAPFARPEGDTIIFGADVDLRQLTAETAGWWAEALMAVPHSILLLRDHGLSHPKAVERLTELFGNFGLTHRIDITKAETAAEFWSQAHLGLAPTRGHHLPRALATLWGGVVMLVPELPERANRELSSLLRHAGLAELIAGSPTDLGALAKHWSKDSSARAAFRDQVRGRLSASPVFDAEARAQDLWQACRQLLA